MGGAHKTSFGLSHTSSFFPLDPTKTSICKLNGDPSHLLLQHTPNILATTHHLKGKTTQLHLKLRRLVSHTTSFVDPWSNIIHPRDLNFTMK